MRPQGFSVVRVFRKQFLAASLRRPCDPVRFVFAELFSGN
jgi:hypothetical protein